MQVSKGYKFSDVLMVPIPSRINSRDTPSLETYGGYSLPFMASPMHGIVGTRLIKQIALLGGIGFLHKFWRYSDDFFNALNKLKGVRYGMAVGTDLTYLEYAADAEMILVDVANGYTNKILGVISTVKSSYPDKIIVAGNVVTKKGANLLTSAGADLVRVGIGNGSLCTTRAVIGIGYPQLSAISECSEVANVIADGGMKTSGDMAKALAAGAVFCMLGGPLALAHESSHRGEIYGMASARLHTEIGKEPKSIEGKVRKAKKTDYLRAILKQYSYGIKSSMTYLDAINLKELRENVQWVEI